MKRTILLFMIPIIFNTTCWSQKSFDLQNELLQQYVGEWTSFDPYTRSITKIIIHNLEDLRVQAFGRCHPEDCSFGTTKLNLISDSPDKNSNVIPFDHALAIWDMDYAKHIMKFRIHTGLVPRLNVEITTIFKDNSGRSNYHLYTIMKKVN